MQVIQMSAVLPDRVVPVGSVSADLPMGSIASDDLDGTRRVYLFGWYEGQHGVFESALGYDHGNDAVRVVSTTRLIPLTDLTDPFELTIHRNSQPRLIRFTLEEGN